MSVDGISETHITRQFAERPVGHDYLCFFNEYQKGKPAWNWKERKVEVNRTEALDASRAAIREKLTTLPRGDQLVSILGTLSLVSKYNRLLGSSVLIPPESVINL